MTSVINNRILGNMKRRLLTQVHILKVMSAIFLYFIQRKNFFINNLAAKGPTLGYKWGGSHHCTYLLHAAGHWDPCNKDGSQSPDKCISRIRTRNLLILRVICYPTVPLKNYEKHFLFPLKNYFCLWDNQFSVIFLPLLQLFLFKVDVRKQNNNNVMACLAYVMICH